MSLQSSHFLIHSAHGLSGFVELTLIKSGKKTDVKFRQGFRPLCEKN